MIDQHIESDLVDKYCAGCGVKLQTTEKDKAGYIPSQGLKKEILTCQRCFKITHYNEVTPVEMGDDDFLRILHSIGNTKSLIVNIVDMFDINGSWINGLPRFVGGNPILLVGNKVDLLPKNMNINRMKNWMKQTAKELGVKPIDVLLCSAEKGHGMDEIMEAMDRYREGGDVYIVGTTNVGKSTFINRILKTFGVADEQLLTTSRFPGTTLDLIEIPLHDGRALFDTPGIINRYQMAHYITPKELKLISPIKPIKPKVYQLNSGQTLFFGGLSRLDYIRGDHQSFVCYVSNLIPIHRTKSEKADELYANHLGEMLSPPAKEHLDQWPEMIKHSFKIPNQATDIVFSGLGWVTVKGEGAVVDAYAPKGVAVTLRNALI